MTIKERTENINAGRLNNIVVKKVIESYVREIETCIKYNELDKGYLMECIQVETLFRLELMKRKYC